MLITVTNANGPPVLSPIGNRSVAEGALLTITLTATDPDGDALTYGVEGLPVGARFDTATGAFAWTPTAAQVGGRGIAFSVSDGALEDREAVTITVARNDAPVFEIIFPQAVAEEETLRFTVTATDPEGAPLTYGARDLPAGA